MATKQFRMAAAYSGTSMHEQPLRSITTRWRWPWRLLYKSAVITRESTLHLHHRSEASYLLSSSGRGITTL